MTDAKKRLAMLIQARRSQEELARRLHRQHVQEQGHTLELLWQHTLECANRRSQIGLLVLPRELLDAVQRLRELDADVLVAERDVLLEGSGGGGVTHPPRTQNITWN